MKTRLARFFFTLWCGWIIVQAPYVGKTGVESDPGRPVYKWDLATFGGGQFAFFDTVKECEERAKQLTQRRSICVPVDWVVKPHPWWQLWK